MYIKLAHRFTEMLRDSMSDQDWEDMVNANQSETDPNICHSHDYVDANQVMIDAIESLDIDIDDIDLANEAWDYAKSNLLDLAIEKCRNGKPIAKCNCC